MTTFPGVRLEFDDRAFTPASPAPEPAPTNGKTEVQGWDEFSLAEQFSLTYPNLRYVAPWSQWLDYRKGVWVKDDVLAVFDRARRICAEMAAALEQESSKSLRSAKTRAAVENLCRSDVRHAATVAQWDRDPWVLNTPGGTIDLHSGEVRPHRAEDYFTKSTSVKPKFAAAPVWNAFLADVTGQDSELRNYLQRAAGYCLTADISEHALFFLHGCGANGKTTFLNCLQGILGDYCQHAQMETFTESKTDRHPTELASLRGARLVLASEIEAGRRLAESRIKSLTGGDPIRARFCHCDEFEFSPTFKLMLCGNHRPSLRTVDVAIRRRVHMVPFSQTIPADKRDLKLGEKLQTEFPQILHWMINGCLEWQRQGLNPPGAVLDATEQYFSSEDALLSWFEERLIISPQAGSTKVGVLYTDYKAWTERTGEFCESQKRFAQNLRDRGFECYISNGTHFKGVTLRPSEQP